MHGSPVGVPLSGAHREKGARSGAAVPVVARGSCGAPTYPDRACARTVGRADSLPPRAAGRPCQWRAAHHPLDCSDGTLASLGFAGATSVSTGWRGADSVCFSAVRPPGRSRRAVRSIRNGRHLQAGRGFSLDLAGVHDQAFPFVQLHGHQLAEDVHPDHHARAFLVTNAVPGSW